MHSLSGLAANLTLHATLSWKLYVLRMLIVRSSDSLDGRNAEKTMDPEPLQRWAEEGLVCVDLEVDDDLQQKKEVYQKLDLLFSSANMLPWRQLF
jgi:hypothetical protein